MTTKSSGSAHRIGRMLGCVGAAVLVLGALATIAWATPASSAKGGGSAITAAANDNANPNSNDHGNGNGPPANGSVGNANDRNPPGQSRGDKNRGYECDDNNGVGKGNPAHSGTCSSGGGEGTSGGGGGVLITPTTTVLPNVTPTAPAPTSGEVLGETVTRPAAQQPAALAFTGMNLTGLLTLAGAGMLFVGLLLLMLAAPRRPEEVIV